jgi:hypothetical protein
LAPLPTFILPSSGLFDGWVGGGWVRERVWMLWGWDAVGSGGGGNRRWVRAERKHSKQARCALIIALLSLSLSSS